LTKRARRDFVIRRRQPACGKRALNAKRTNPDRSNIWWSFGQNQARKVRGLTSWNIFARRSEERRERAINIFAWSGYDWPIARWHLSDATNSDFRQDACLQVATLFVIDNNAHCQLTALITRVARVYRRRRALPKGMKRTRRGSEASFAIEARGNLLAGVALRLSVVITPRAVKVVRLRCAVRKHTKGDSGRRISAAAAARESLSEFRARVRSAPAARPRAGLCAAVVPSCTARYKAPGRSTCELRGREKQGEREREDIQSKRGATVDKFAARVNHRRIQISSR